jgi:hypothetical protein
MTDRGPVLPLYLNREETEALLVTVKFYLDDQERTVFSVETTFGPAGQVPAAARRRHLVLRSLVTTLSEHVTAIDDEM